MGRTVMVITLVAVSGDGICLAAGDEWELPEASARERIRLGLARPIDAPQGAVETAAVMPAAETRAARRRAKPREEM